jgi:hypothetical protein
MTERMKDAFLLTLLVLIAVGFIFVIRMFLFQLAIVPFSEPYYHERIALDPKILVSGIDGKIFGFRPYILQPYHVLLSVAHTLIPEMRSYLFITPLLGIVAILMLYLIMGTLGVSRRNSWITVIILIFSSMFFLTFGLPNTSSLMICLVFVGVYIFVAHKDHSWVSFVILLSSAFFGFPAFLFALVVYMTIFNFLGITWKRVFWWILPPLLLFLTVQGGMMYYYGWRMPIRSIASQWVVSLTSDFGGLYGIGIFHWILAVIGLVQSWKFKKSLVPIYLFLAVIIFFGATSPDLMRFWNIFASFFAAYALVSMLDQHWEIDLLRQVTILVLICGLLFSLVSFYNERYTSPPNDYVMQAMNWLSRNSDPNAVVLAPYSRGSWIAGPGNRTVLLDEEFPLTNGLSTRQNITQTVFHHYSLPVVRKIMINYSINYIYIDNPMKQGEVWSKPDEGLLFLLKDNETFNKEYSNGYVEIWHFFSQKRKT